MELAVEHEVERGVEREMVCVDYLVERGVGGLWTRSSVEN